MTTLRLFLVSLALLMSPQLVADEGMYTFDDPPLELWKSKYGFEPSPEWLDKAQKAAVRFNNGGSGSFVSSSGLVMTNHHVGLDCIQKLSTGDDDLVSKGYLAATQADEKSCPDLELNQLMAMKDVTAEVDEALAGVADPAEQAKAKKKTIATLEDTCATDTGLRCNVVTLYGGGKYVLYQYKKHTDVRLVFAPEKDIAFFGGDPDNFTYPRYDLDVAFFRVYEDGKPLGSEYFFPWSDAGADEGDLIFVVGNPGRTGRLLTLSQLEYQRDVAIPARLELMKSLLATLKEYSAKGKEQTRQAMVLIFGLENAIKFYSGVLKGLAKEAIWQKKVAQEEELVAKAKAKPEVWSGVKGSWDAIAKVQGAKADAAIPYGVVSLHLRASKLLSHALTAVQLVTELSKPSGERLDEYLDSNLASLELSLYSTAPVYDEYEVVVLTHLLEKLSASEGTLGEVATTVLAGSTPSDKAKAIVEGTTLKGAEALQAFVEAGKAKSSEEWASALAASDDPLVALVAALDPVLRELRKTIEEEIEIVEKTEGGAIAKARFAVYGKSLPPDATFTLRIAFGEILPYEAEGTIVPVETTFYGLYNRYYSFGGKAPFSLPASWKEAEKKLDLSTPYNFIATADTVGGNSGSPVIDKSGAIVGILFDGNIHKHILRYVYDDTQARSVMVHSAGIIEALDKVYGAKKLIEELGKK